jgi:hypothetical protein
LAPLAAPASFAGLLCQAAGRAWVVYSKRPFAGPAQVLRYLARYTHRIALGAARLRALDREAHTVTFAYKDYADGGQQKTMTLGWLEFLRRFLLHLLPARFVKIRHSGLLGNRGRAARLAAVRAAFGVAPPSPSALGAALPAAPPPPAAAPPWACPHCGSVRRELVRAVRPIRGYLDSS